MKIDPNAPAYPVPIYAKYNGLTIRAEFAARAMQGLLAMGPGWKPEDAAYFAVANADALIDALSKEKPIALPEEGRAT